MGKVVIIDDDNRLSRSQLLAAIRVIAADATFAEDGTLVVPRYPREPIVRHIAPNVRHIVPASVVRTLVDSSHGTLTFAEAARILDR